MTQYLIRFLAAAVVAGTVAAPAQAGPFNGPAEVAIPAVPNTNFVQLKQVSGFTGQLPLSVSDGGYAPVGTSFNKLAKFRLSLNCPTGYGVHKAGIRVRGDDAPNRSVEILSPGDVPFNQSAWQQDINVEPWIFDSVVQTGAEALDAASNNGPLYISLEETLESRVEFYGWCVSTDPLDQTAMYYDSSEDDGHAYPKTRVRYQVMASVAVSPALKLQTAPQAVQRRGSVATLQLRPRLAEPQAQGRLKAPGGCPYDCPPPARSLRLND